MIQERTHAFALKSSLVLLDPRPDLAHMVRMVEEGFALSEASNTPVMLELRIRACHVRGSFVCKDNVAPAISTRHLHGRARRRSTTRGWRTRRSTFRQEKLKGDERMPGGAALHRRAAPERDCSPAARDDLGIIVQGGLYNSLVRALQQLGLADAFGASALSDAGAQRHLSAGAGGDPRLLRRQARGAGGRGRPARVHRAGDRSRSCAGATSNTPMHGKDLLPMAGEYTVEVIARGARRVRRAARAGAAARRRAGAGSRRSRRAARRSRAQLAQPLPARPPQLLRRLPGAAGVRGAEARAAGHRPRAHRRRHRLPLVRDLRAVLARATRSSATA